MRRLLILAFILSINLTAFSSGIEISQFSTKAGSHLSPLELYLTADRPQPCSPADSNIVYFSHRTNYIQNKLFNGLFIDFPIHVNIPNPNYFFRINLMSISNHGIYLFNCLLRL